MTWTLYLGDRAILLNDEEGRRLDELELPRLGGPTGQHVTFFPESLNGEEVRIGSVVGVRLEKDSGTR
jgi:hypothetical protein